MDYTTIRGLLDEIEKIAEDADEYTVVPTTRSAGMSAQDKARGVRYGMPRQDYQEAMNLGSLKGMGMGAGLGLGLGAVGGGLAAVGSRGRLTLPSGLVKGTLAGLMVGAPVGSFVGVTDADKKYMADRGIKQTYRSFGRGEFTPGAAKKYLAPTHRKAKEKTAIQQSNKDKVAMIVAMRTPPGSMDPEIGGQQGARAGRLLGGLVGGGAGHFAGFRRGGLKAQVIGTALGALGGVGAGHLIGKASGKKSAELLREATMSDMRQRLNMIKQLRAENRLTGEA